MEEQNIVWAKIKTKSNFRNLNGELLKVSEIRGNYVSCFHFDVNFSRVDIIDFSLSEVEWFTGLVLRQEY